MKARSRYHLITTAISLFLFLLFIGCNDEIKEGENSTDQLCATPIELSSPVVEFDHKANSKTIQVKEVDNFLLDSSIKIDDEYFFMDEANPEKVSFGLFPIAKSESDLPFKMGEIIEITGEWFMIIKESENTIRIEVEENEGSETRTLATSILCGGCYTILEVVQEGI